MYVRACALPDFVIVHLGDVNGAKHVLHTCVNVAPETLILRFHSRVFSPRDHGGIATVYKVSFRFHPEGVSLLPRIQHRGRGGCCTQST